jgi:hypothetical protein
MNFIPFGLGGERHVRQNDLGQEHRLLERDEPLRQKIEGPVELVQKRPAGTISYERMAENRILAIANGIP